MAILWALTSVAIAGDFCNIDSVDSGAVGTTVEPDKHASIATDALDGDDAVPDADAGTNEFNLDILIVRLKETDALGVFTKLALKGDVEEIIEMAHEYKSLTALPELQSVREQFDGLVLKTITLLNDKDPDLAADMYQARDLVWQSILEVEI